MVGLSTFVVNILTALAIAAGTDYAIFLVGRYQEARHIGQNREASFYTMYRGPRVAPSPINTMGRISSVVAIER